MVRCKTANPLFYGRDAKDNSWTYQSRGITSSVAPSFLVEGHTTPTSSVALNYRTQKPLEIRASNGMRVVFTHSRDRKDTRGDSPEETGRSLSAITVYNGDGNRVGQWQFKYGYFMSPVVGDDSTAGPAIQDFPFSLQAVFLMNAIWIIPPKCLMSLMKSR